MAVSEKSVGDTYVAWVEVTRRRVPVHRVGVVEEVSPWRRGRAVVFPAWPFRGIVVGRWHASGDPDEEEGWLSPQWLDRVPVDEIRQWGADDEEAEEAQA